MSDERDLTAPATTLAWNVYGTGPEAVGRDGAPEWVPVLPPRPDQLLIRVDAVGLCFSDVKLIRAGGSHPKLYGRDLTKEPTRIGHETAVTVIEVGETLRDQFRPGQRLAIQPDIYVDGRSTAYGYTIPGGLIGYHCIGPEVLAADDGAYVVELDDRLGDAEAALTEPWACVEAAYTQRRRLWPLSGGRAWIIGTPGDSAAYQFGDLLAESRDIVLTDVDAALATELRRRWPGVAFSTDAGVSAPGIFDDIVVLGSTSAAQVGMAADALAFRGVMALVGERPLDGPVDLDVGRLHYHYTAYVGTTGLDVLAAYGETRNPAELRAGGITMVIGAAGPMGQMHLERALLMPDGPATVVGVDLDPDRMAAATARLRPLADVHQRNLVMTRTGDGATVSSVAREVSDGRGVDDVVVTAPVVQAVTDGAAAMAPDGMLVLFAGVPVGTRASLDLSPVFLHGARYTGTSGSRIADQARVVQKTLVGQLSPARSLGAVGGMEAAVDGLRALIDGRFPGKIVIFPGLHGLPLMSVADLAAGDPAVAAALGEDGSWTRAAEAVLRARYGSTPAPVP